ncbi:conserved hypothetical protein [Treponema primitia ZAS-2]|uniref:DUF4258 domain-containing protein n=1 Tax=Treponema primitia (strain ATCC BAA-887 / DSM 12427 / ZAS-2) TaxID=545694 RepID=F5YIZ4_TREPZ|nr:DUF4258 domain-containing protein [Treponema primitia]AEF85184.1 conserved hypothetical protein [Treponema primitia ZAS-2]
MLEIADLQALCADETIALTGHVLARMRQRGIRYTDIKHTIQTGEIIEQYATDYPYPSCLISSVDLHIVCGIGNGVLYIITAYRPSAEKWEADGKTRRS